MKLADYLTKRGVKPSHFASEAGVPASTIFRILTGQRPSPRIATLEKIRRASDGEVTPNDFADDIREKKEAADAALHD